MLSNPPILYDFCVGVPISLLLTVGCLKCESGSSRFHPGEGPSAFSVIVKLMDRFTALLL